MDRKVSNCADHESRGTGVAFPRAVKPCPDRLNPVSLFCELDCIGLEEADRETCHQDGQDLMDDLARVNGSCLNRISRDIAIRASWSTDIKFMVIPSRHIPPTPIGPSMILQSLSIHESYVEQPKINNRARRA